jgi:U3 small nucleolar ribonucleoprotein component
MAKAPKKTVKTLSDKLIKVNENFTIYMYDNGFMIEINGRDADDEWATAKIMVNSVDDLIGLVREAVDMERQS